ncbi:MAG: hypothetical protein LBR37_00915 [Erysipelotrichaceae bacterium]|nr:hypothetical protein [Erysipelotrichaceae bacterium]
MILKNKKVAALFLLPILLACKGNVVLPAPEPLVTSAMVALKEAKNKINLGESTSELQYLGAIQFSFDTRPLEPTDTPEELTGVIYAFQILKKSPVAGDSGTKVNEETIYGLARRISSTISTKLDFEETENPEIYQASITSLISGMKRADYTPPREENMGFNNFQVITYYTFDLEDIQTKYLTL